MSVRSMVSLRRLDLSDTEIGDKTLAIVGRMPGLRHLYLMQTKVTDSGLENLRGLEDLSVLDLRGTRVSSIPKWIEEKDGLQVFFP